MLPGLVIPIVLALGLNLSSDEVLRLGGHSIEKTSDGMFHIKDIAGEGQPIVGRIKRKGSELWLTSGDETEHRLRGPLAVPRIAGPGYRVWVVGDINGHDLLAKRIGILSPPL